MQVRCVEGVALRHLDDDAMLLHPTGQSALSVNSTALAIWERCGEGADTDQLAADLADLYAVDVDTVRPQISATVQQLLDLGFLEQG